MTVCYSFISVTGVYCVWFDNLIEANIISHIAEIDVIIFVLNSDLSSVLGRVLPILRMFVTF